MNKETSGNNPLMTAGEKRIFTEIELIRMQMEGLRSVLYNAIVPITSQRMRLDVQREVMLILDCLVSAIDWQGPGKVCVNGKPVQESEGYRMAAHLLARLKLHDCSLDLLDGPKNLTETMSCSRAEDRVQSESGPGA